MADETYPTIAKTLMSFSALAYVVSKLKHDYDKARKEIEQQVPIVAQEPGWRLVWGPGIGYDDHLRANSAYIAYNSTTNAYAVVIEGTMDLWAWLVENAENRQEPCDYIIPGRIPPGEAGLVSKGFEKARGILMGPMEHTSVTIPTFLQDTMTGKPTVYVTGHSQGGATCQLVAAWLRYWQYKGAFNPDADIQVYGYAGPTAGNPTMATYLNGLFGQSFRYQNPYDCAGLAFNDVLGMKTVYVTGLPPSEQIKPNAFESGIITVINDSLEGVIYRQPETNVPFSASAVVPGKSWIDEVGYQHNHLNYCTWLGAKVPSVPTEIEAG